jgi:DNA polymerase-1
MNQAIICDRIVGRTRTVLVLDYPTNLEASRGQLLQGDTGKLIRATLKAFDIDIRDIHVITALNCKPNTSRPKELRESMERCRARLLRELRTLNADKVLCCGTIGYAALTSTDKIPRMEKVHSKWMSVYGMQLIGTYSPTRVIMDTELFRDFYRSFEKFFTTDGREPWPNIQYTIPVDSGELYDAMLDIGAFTDQQLSCDIETTGFSPFENDILAIGFGSIIPDFDNLQLPSTKGEVVIITQDLLSVSHTWQIIADQLQYGRTSFHNGKFDLKFIIQGLLKFGIDYQFNNIDDTLLLNYCLDERPWGRYGAHSLKNISRVRYDAPDYDINVGKWLAEYKKATPERQQEMLAELYNYLALDCYYTARLAYDLRKDVTEEGESLLELYEWLLIPASLALTEIELRGCKLDRNYLEGMREKLTHDLEVSTQKIREYVENPEFNPGSVKQTHTLLYKTLGLPVTKTERKGKLQEGPTSQPVMRILRSRYPEHRELLDEIIKWRGIKKTLGTYVYGLLDRMEQDGRVRSDFLLHGTSTGRISSVNPNLQNISVESHTGFDIRTAFIPEDDEWLFIESDYSQLELRVAAHLTGDSNFIQAYIDGRDLHKDASLAIFQKNDITDYERVMSKNMVFGAMYDRGAPSLAFGPEMDYLENELGGKRWTLKEVETFFKRFFERYPQLAEWQAEQKRAVYREQVLETELGRLRRFPLITDRDNGAVGRQGINTPIQSLASDITLDALIRIHARLKKLNRKAGRVVAHIVLTVHDSILTECRSSYAKQVKIIIAEEMATVPIDTVVPFAAKITTGKNRGNLK